MTRKIIREAIEKEFIEFIEQGYLDLAIKENTYYQSIESLVERLIKDLRPSIKKTHDRESTLEKLDELSNNLCESILRQFKKGLIDYINYEDIPVGNNGISEIWEFKSNTERG